MWLQTPGKVYAVGKVVQLHSLGLCPLQQTRYGIKERCYTIAMNEDQCIEQTPQNNSARDFALLATVMTIGLLIFCVALFHYDQSHNVGTQAYNKAMAAVSTANKQITTVSTQNKTLTTQNATLTTQNTELRNEKSQFCGELGKAKINDPLCTQ